MITWTKEDNVERQVEGRLCMALNAKLMNLDFILYAMGNKEF